MPLVELLQNLQSFNYYYGGPGNFTQKSIPYGTGDEPYIRFPLPENASSAILDYYASNRSSLDFPIRGGGVDYLSTGLIVSKHAKYDYSRIKKFLKSSPKGYTFIAKQIGLQLSNPKIEVGNQFNLVPGRAAGFSGVIESTRIYNGGINTLIQIAAEGSGIHVDRHGTVPYNPLSQTYSKVVDSYNQANNGIDNRLVTLLNAKIHNTPRTDLNRDNLRRLGISTNPNLLFQYPGGPESVYGIGLTTIPRNNNNNALYRPDYPSPLYVQGNFEVPILGPSVRQPNGLYIRPSQTVNLKDVGTPISLADIQSDLNPNGRERGYMLTRFLSPADNRLVRLQNHLLLGGTLDKGPIFGMEEKVKFSGDRANVLFTYTDTNTDIKRSEDANTNINLQKVEEQTDSKNNDALAFNYAQIYNSTKDPFHRLLSRNGFIRKDFRKVINTDAPKTQRKLPVVEYQTKSMEARLGVLDAGLKKETFDYTKTSGNSTDRVNAADVGTNYETSDTKGEKISDLIKFRFTAVEYDSTKTTPLIFRAYVTSFQDSHTGEFGAFRYVGRGENFYTYNGFTRNISFNFKIAAESREEMKPLYRKLNYLASQLYPDYNKSGFMRSPLMEMTIGDYIFEQPGFLTSVNITVADDYPWEINLEKTMHELPQILDVSCQFIPIHDFLPRRSKRNGKGFDITPLITPPGSGQKWLVD